MKISCKWLLSKELIAAQRTQNPVIGQFLAETTARYMNQYIPMDTGMLSQTYSTAPFEIAYSMPYAHYQWKGVSRKGTPLHYSKEKHSRAQAQWHKAVEVEKGPMIIAEVQEFMKRL